MKALTIWQPWASLIVDGAKAYEFRRWRPPAAIVGQRIAIHAAKRPPEIEDLNILVDDLAAARRHGRKRHSGILVDEGLALLMLRLPGEYPLSAVLGTALVGEPIQPIRHPADFPSSPLETVDPGIWAWPMLEVELLLPGVPCGGRQGLWNWEGP